MTFDKCIHSCNYHPTVGVCQLYSSIQRNRFWLCVCSPHIYVLLLCLLLFIIWLCPMVPSEGIKDNLFHASPLASGGLLAIFGVSRLIDASPHLCLHLPWCCPWLCACLSPCPNLPLFIRTVILIKSTMTTSS